MTIEIKEGMKFKNKWMPEHTMEVLTVTEDKNLLLVWVGKGEKDGFGDEWNLQHTIWGFERGEYHSPIYKEDYTKPQK